MDAMMKKLIAFLTFSVLLPMLHAQSTLVTATITDTDSQTWNNGTVTATFVPGPTQAYKWPGGAISNQVTGTMNGSGTFTISLPDNTTITPLGSAWRFTICPNATSGCQSKQITVAGASMNLSTQLSAIASGPRFAASPWAYGYLDSEIWPIPLQGALYWNVTNLVMRVWTGIVWQNLTAGAGIPYPSAGIPQSTGSAWGTSLSASTFVFNNQANTYGAYLQDFSAASLKLPNTAGTCTHALAEDASGNLVTVACSSGGSTVNVNGAPVSNPNFNSTSPLVDVGNTPVVWKVSGSNVLGEVAGTFPSNANIVCTGSSRCDDDAETKATVIPVTSFTAPSSQIVTFTTASTSLVSLAVNAGGSGWAVGDQFSIAGGSSGYGVVSAISGGGSTGPATTVAVFLNGSGYSTTTAVATTAVSPSTGTGLTVNTTVGHGLNAGDWVNVRYLTSGVWPALPSYLILGTGYTLFQVQSAGLTAQQFEINVGSLAVSACSASCGTVESAMNNLAFQIPRVAGMPAQAINHTYMMLPSDVTVHGVATLFPQVFGPMSPSVTGTPGYLFIEDAWNDINECHTVAQIEADYQKAWQQAHQYGYVVVQSTLISVNQNTNYGAGSCSYPAGPYNEMYSLDQWLQLQGKTQANIASGAYWDIYSDAGMENNDPITPGLTDWSVTGFQNFANAIANAMLTGTGMPLPRVPLRYGQPGTGNLAASNAWTFVPPSNGSSCTWAFADHAWTNNILCLNASPSPWKSTFNSQLTVNGASYPNFLPAFIAYDNETNYLNSAIKSWYFATPLVPYTDTSRNNLTMEIGTAVGINGSPNLPAGQGGDIFFGYNSTSTPSLNHIGLHIVGDSYDSLHAATGGQVCVGVNTSEATGGQEGCPTTKTFSVGTTGQWSVDSSGNAVGASLTTGLSADPVTPTNGQLWYNTTTNILKAYINGATVALGNPLTSPLTTKGDLWGYSSTNARVPVGADGQVLSADSTQTTGLKWIAAATNPMTTLGDTIYGGASGASTRLAGNTSATTECLTQTGDGTNSAAPVWGACSGSAATAFSAITGSTNTSAAMLVGTGASLGPTGTGTVTSNQSIIFVANAGTTGTTANTLTKLTGAPSTAVIAATTDTSGMVGIVTAGAGTSGSATIQTAGLVNCVFSNATTAGDYVQISSGTAGDCVDSGATYPTSGQVIGRVLSTNASAGTYQIDIFPPEMKAASGGGSTLPYVAGNAYGGTGSGSASSITSSTLTVASGDNVFAICRGGASTVTVTMTTGLSNTCTQAGRHDDSATAALTSFICPITNAGSDTFICNYSTAGGFESVIALNIKGMTSTVNNTAGAAGANATTYLENFSVTLSQKTVNVNCWTVGSNAVWIIGQSSNGDATRLYDSAGVSGENFPDTFCGVNLSTGPQTTFPTRAAASAAVSWSSLLTAINY